MKKNVILILLTLSLLLCLSTSLIPATASAAKNENDIIILYENDVHCAIEGYSKLSAMKNELFESYTNVGVVSVGDYIQGSSLGSISKGEYIVNIMNLVGYDAITLGNHEFDFRIDRLNELVALMNVKPISCNFQKISEPESYYEPYSIVSYGDVDIAYIGITTPSTITLSSPSQFKNDKDEYIYTFNGDKLYEVVQKNIDSAISNGADYVIALSHIGYEDDEQYEDIVNLIENTNGFDVVLDGHSHSVIENMKITDKGGNDVILSSTGTKFAHIGKLTISNGTITTELIKTDDYEQTNSVIDTYIKEINDAYATLGERKIAYSEVELITHDEDGNRLVRVAETNLGDLCADAFRIVTGADIGYINGGGIRSNIKKGDITFNDVLSVFPFNNKVVVAEVSGQVIKDMIEMSLLYWPDEDGSFPHMSGIKFSVNKSIESPVIVDSEFVFSGISGEYRVYNIKVLDKESGEYLPLELDKNYTFSSHNYLLLDGGSGMSMFKDAKIIQNDGMLDVELLEKYIVENLNGVVGDEYSKVNSNITFTDGQITDEEDNMPPKTNDDSQVHLWFLFAAIASYSVLVFAKKRTLN